MILGWECINVISLVFEQRIYSLIYFNKNCKLLKSRNLLDNPLGTTSKKKNCGFSDIVQKGGEGSGKR